MRELDVDLIRVWQYFDQDRGAEMLKKVDIFANFVFSKLNGVKLDRSRDRGCGSSSEVYRAGRGLLLAALHRELPSILVCAPLVAVTAGELRCHQC